MRTLTYRPGLSINIATAGSNDLRMYTWVQRWNVGVRVDEAALRIASVIRANETGTSDSALAAT
eukprot:5518780-Pyramimonas_sp.AAC.1